MLKFVKVLPHCWLCSYCMTSAETALTICSCCRRGSRDPPTLDYSNSFMSTTTVFLGISRQVEDTLGNGIANSPSSGSIEQGELSGIIQLQHSPQNPVPFDVPGIRQGLKDALKKWECRELIQDLLDAVKSKKNPLAKSGDVMSLFESVYTA